MPSLPFYRAPGNPPPPDPEVAFTQEVRFAVVMYGGVSLAIYMNGVAQELLRLVRATAQSTDEAGRVRWKNGELKGTEAVYRKLGQMLRGAGEVWRKAQVEVGRRAPAIATRFVIDVISGTSAGGINGVFLAKALANDQEMDALSDLWIEEGDFSKLMYKPGARRAQTQSLLDGRYMCRALLEALEGMEATRDSTDTEESPRLESPYVEELDLYLTATDISGLMLPLQLADGVIQERRHRNVFHFSYSPVSDFMGKQRNDFSRRFNPFLAFAARSTSSFPVAFEPMKLGDINDVVRSVEPYRGKRGRELKEYLALSETWRDFFQDYLESDGEVAAGLSEEEREQETRNRAEESARKFARRAFGDGGYLDNKPFSYATDALLHRRADLPVSRKLIFVDPDPQNPEDEPDFDGDVDVLKNTLAALSPTVSTETIREDIQRILERNRLIERIRHVTADLDRDIEIWRKAHPAETPPTGDEWAALDVRDLIKQKGVAYGGYHRLKVASVTDELALIIVAAANLRRDSDEFFAVRRLVRAWRKETYDDYRGGAKPTQNRFLLDLDLDFRLRRLNFLRAKCIEMSCLNQDNLTKALTGKTSVHLPLDPAYFRGRLRKLQQQLNDVQSFLLRLQRECHVRGAKNQLYEYARAGGFNKETLKKVLDARTADEGSEVARQHLRDNPATMQALNDMAEALASSFIPYTTLAAKLCELILNPPPDLSDPASDETRAAQEVLWNYYEHFEDYDAVIFPIAYQTGVGETVPVDVIRVSPYDAESILKEREEDRKERDGKRFRHKLGGRELGHFGAFFERSWRKNDIIWGRLDAAERIIKTLLPKDHPDCQALIDEALQAILEEELLSPETNNEVRRVFVRSLVTASANGSAKPRPEAIRAVLKQLSNSPPSNVALNSVLDSCVERAQLLDYFRADDGYEVDRHLDPKEMARLLARATTIFGRMLETLAEKNRINKKQVAWVTRLGQVFWGFVEVAVPGGVWNLAFRHWIKLLYTFEVILIVWGLLLTDAAMQRFGFTAFAITATAHAGVTLLGDYMRRGRFVLFRPLVGLIALLVAVPLVASVILGSGQLLAVLKLREKVASFAPVTWLAQSAPFVWLMGSRPVGWVTAFFVWVVSFFGGLDPAWRSLAALITAALLVVLVAVLYVILRLIVGWSAGVMIGVGFYAGRAAARTASAFRRLFARLSGRSADADEG
jgi:patatin-related protein